MSKSKRVSVGFTEREHSALATIAEHECVGISTMIGRIARAHLATGELMVSEPQAPGTTSPALSAAAEKGPAWLPPLNLDERERWVRDRAAGVQLMIDRYPAELAALGEGWPRDAAVREQLWALSVWRDLLDTGSYEDPRMELAFASSLAEFARYLGDRPRTTARRRP